MKKYVKPIIETTELCGSDSVMLSMSNGVNPGKDTPVLAPPGFGFRNPFDLGSAFGGFDFDE